MKTIVVATDFSYNARNAVDYAAEFARVANAKLILFHVFNIPVLPPEGMPIIPPADVLDEMQEECLSSLNEIKEELESKKYKNVECICREGIIVDEINKLANEKNIDLVIMGVKGKNPLMDIMLGNTTAAFIANGNYPLLAINEYVSFSKIKRIVLACGNEPITNQSVLAPLKEVVSLFKAQLSILNVVPKPALVFSGSKANASVSFESMLEEVKHTVHFIENEDVIDGINQYSEESNAGMIAMIPGKHKGLKELFHRSNSRKMIFHTHIPLLILPNVTSTNNN